MKFFGCLVEALRVELQGGMKAARGIRWIGVRTHCSSAVLHGDSGGIGSGSKTDGTRGRYIDF